MLLTADIRNNIIDVVLINMYTENNAGYAFGKTGIALTLLNIASRFKSRYAYLEEHAVALLEEILALNIDIPSFMNGNAGIGFALNQSISNALIDADFLDLFATRQNDIINYIKSMTSFDDEKYFDYLDYMFFTEALENRISSKDIYECQEILLIHINTYIDLHISNIDTWIYRRQYYAFAIKLMSLINSLQSYNSKYAKYFLSKIWQNELKLSRQGYVCPYITYYCYMLISTMEMKQYVYADLIAIKNISIENLKNIIPEILSFKELIDVSYLLLQIKGKVKDIDCDNIINNVISQYIDTDKIRIENKIKHTLFDSAGYNIGIYGGLSRLLILDCFWDDMFDGKFQDHITKLFY